MNFGGESIDEHQGLGFGTDGHNWASDDLPVRYYVNKDGTPDVPGIWDEVWEVKYSFDTWESDVLSVMDYTFEGIIDKVAPVKDGWNVIDWVDMGYGAAAICYLWYSDWPWERWRIIEFDIVFNDYFQWTIAGKYEPPGNWLDIRNVGTHEAGHTLTLVDLYLDENSQQTMYSEVYYFETKKRSLEYGDEDGIRYIYPKYAKPYVDIYQPFDGETVYGTVEIIAYVSSGDGISEVKYKAHGIDYPDYDSGWVSMWYDDSDGLWYGWWYTSGLPSGYYYITVRAKSEKNIYGYDYIKVYVSPGP